MEGKREGEEAEAAGRPEMQEAAGSGEALCLRCSLGPRVHNVHYFLGSVGGGCAFSIYQRPRGWDLHSQALSKGTGQSQALVMHGGLRGVSKQLPGQRT